MQSFMFAFGALATIVVVSWFVAYRFDNARNGVIFATAMSVVPFLGGVITLLATPHTDRAHALMLLSGLFGLSAIVGGVVAFARLHPFAFFIPPVGGCLVWSFLHQGEVGEFMRTYDFQAGLLMFVTSCMCAFLFHRFKTEDR